MDGNAATQLEFEFGDDKKYKVKEIWNTAAYKIELKASYLPGLYYLVSSKSYPEEKSI